MSDVAPATGTATCDHCGDSITFDSSCSCGWSECTGRSALGAAEHRKIVYPYVASVSLDALVGAVEARCQDRVLSGETR